MKNPRFYIAILAGILVNFLFSLIFPKNIVTSILGIFTALKIANPDKPKIGALIGALVFIGYSLITFKSVIAPIYDPRVHEIYMLVIAIVLDILLAGGIGAVLGIILFKVFQLLQKNKVMY